METIGWEGVRRPVSGSGIPPAISVAIEDSNPYSVRKELAELQADDRTRAASSLLEFWKCHMAIGESTDKATNYYLVRIAIAEFLAQAIRNERVSFPLDSFRQFAISRLNNSSSSYEKLQVIPLIGISDSHQSVGMLEKIVRENPRSPGFQTQAIEALSYICHASARETLERLTRDPQIALSQARVLERAKAKRAMIESAWCE